VLLGIDADDISERILPMQPKVTGEGDFAVYPNPANESIVISYQGNDKAFSAFEMNIYDIYSKLVKTYILKNEAEIIDIIDLPQGMYVYRLSRNNELLQTGKLIKM